MARTQSQGASLLLAAQRGSARELLEPEVEAMVAEAIRTRDLVRLVRFACWVASVVRQHRASGASLPPRLVTLRQQLAFALAEVQKGTSTSPGVA